MSQKSIINMGRLHPFWSKFFNFDWKFGLSLLLIVCGVRFAMTLNANVEGNYL